MKMGSETATISDAARAWLEIQKHMDGLQRSALNRITNNAGTDLALLKSLWEDRLEKGLKDPHFLAIFLDPRPSMRQFVLRMKLFGCEADKTLGNTPELQAAQRELKVMAKSGAIELDGKDSDAVGADLCTALLIYLEVWCSNRPKDCMT